MDQRLEESARMLKDYKKDNYCFGQDCRQAAGKYCLEFGQKPLLMISERKWADNIRKEIKDILDNNHVDRPITIDSPPVDNPVMSVMAAAEAISQASPDLLLVVGGGSAIDCIKAANVAASLDTENLESFLGIGKVSEALKKTGKKMYPMVAVQTIAGSGSHLSKNSVINYPRIGQKKIITDMALVPDRAVFDYSVTTTMGRDLTLDGALDGFSHCLEVYYGSGDSDLTEQVCLNCISLIVDYLPLLLKDLDNLKYRHAIGLATDLGGYALMLGGTSGPHLNSFSMVELTSHGRACAILNPYYTVFYSPAIEDKLKKLVPVFEQYMDSQPANDSRSLGEAAGRSMLSFYRAIGFPTTLGQLDGYDSSMLPKVLENAKNPQLTMKLKSMPVALNLETVDEYMEPILKAAESGNLGLIKNLT